LLQKHEGTGKNFLLICIEYIRFAFCFRDGDANISQVFFGFFYVLAKKKDEKSENNINQN